MSNEHESQPLTSAGVQRRDHMLGELLDVVRDTRRRRRGRKRVMFAGAAMLLSAITLQWVRENSPYPPRTIQSASTSRTTQAIVERVGASSLVLTEYVATDSLVLGRLRADPARLVIWLDDAGLLDALASIHRPAGLVRHDQHVRLTSPVTDEELLGQR